MVRFNIFVDMKASDTDGAAIWVISETMLVCYSDAFWSVYAGDSGSMLNGVIFLSGILGFNASFCCVTNCGSFCGSFVCVASLVNVSIRGLAVLDAQSAGGAVNVESSTVTMSNSNFTNLNASWGGQSELSAVFYQTGASARVAAAGLLVTSCDRGLGLLLIYRGGPAGLSQCVFVRNFVGAIARDSVEGQDVLEACFFAATPLRGTRFAAGSVLLQNCLFAGEVLSTASFVPTGVAIPFASTEVAFDWAELVDSCPPEGVVRVTANAPPSPTEEPTAVPSPTQSLEPTPVSSPIESLEPTPAASAEPTANSSSEAQRGLSAGTKVWIVVAVVVTIATVVAILLVVKCRRPSHYAREVGVHSLLSLAGESALVPDTHDFQTQLEWHPRLDANGMISRFPMEFDQAQRGLPLLLAAFDRRYLLRVLFPRAVAAVLAVGGAEASGLLSAGVATELDEEALRANTIHLYTRPEIYAEVNRLMRLESGRNEPGSKLWAFVAILQMAFVKAVKDSSGGVLFRGGLISLAELTELRRAMSAHVEAELVLRGMTSCSRSESVAAEFAGRSAPTSSLVRVMFCVSLQEVGYTQLKQKSSLPYGAAVPVEYLSKFHEEKEVVLLDGVGLKVSPGDVAEQCTTAFTAEVGSYGFECVRIKARVDWEALDAYFALCDKARK
jgi:hypothetical protein